MNINIFFYNYFIHINFKSVEELFKYLFFIFNMLHKYKCKYKDIKNKNNFKNK